MTTEVALTRRPGHAAEIVRDADLAVFDGVVAGGGDGTLFEVVNGLFVNGCKLKPPIGVLPVGTGNAFSRDIDLGSGALERAVELIGDGHHRPVDVGRFSADGDVRYFVNILGLGFVSDVGERARRIKRIGNLAYTVGVFLELIRLSTHRMTIEIDGETLERENIFCEISNTRYTSNFLMAPSASFDDGLLDVTLLGGISRTRLVRCFPSIFSGEHVHLDEVETFTARTIRVTTDRPKTLTPDGEILGSTPVEVECLHRAIDVFAPPSSMAYSGPSRPTPEPLTPP